MLHLGRVTDRRSMRPVAAVQPSTKQKKRIASNVAGIDTGDAPGTPCPQCETTGFKNPQKTSSGLRQRCGGIGYHGIDPFQPCRNERGTNARVGVYAARYRAGLPIFNDADHRPADVCNPLREQGSVHDVSPCLRDGLLETDEDEEEES